MSHTPHELENDFPEYRDLIQRLKAENTHFARLAEEYHEVNRAIHRAEALVEPVDEVHERELRHRRVVLKDDIYAIIRKAAEAAGT